MLVPLCPVPKTSWQLSERRGNPEIPPLCRSVQKLPEPPGQQFVGIALVADVPDDPVVGRREDRLERNGQLDDPEAGRQVTAGAGNRGDDGFANLGREPLLLLVREGGDRGARVDPRQQRCRSR